MLKVTRHATPDRGWGGFSLGNEVRRRWSGRLSLFRFLAALSLAFWAAARVGAAVPPAEQLLPDDTLLMITVPDVAQARALYALTPQSRLWHDPAMKAFADKFDEQLNEQLIAPLEREFGIRWADCTRLPQGQFTYALVPDKPPGNGPPSIAMLVLVDVHDKTNQLGQALADLKQQWVDSGKTVRTERLRDCEFTVLMAAPSEMPQDLRDALNPPRTYIDPTGRNRPPTPVEPSPEELSAVGVKRSFYVGQVGSLLLVSTSARPAERILARLDGAQVPALQSVPSYAADRDTLFREAPLFGWINAKPYLQWLLREPGNEPNPPELTNGPPENALFLTFGTARLLAALGLGTVKSVGFSLRESPDGSLFQLRADVPEADRAGLLSLLAGESTDSGPPSFVPADAASFWRWRVNGPKAWDALQQTLAELNPQLATTLNWLVDSAGEAARQTDSNFDLRKTLLASLGDDIVAYQKAPPADAPAGAVSPSLYLLRSPQPEQLVSALKALFILLPQPDPANATRDFLGHEIYSVLIPVLPGSEPPAGGNRTLYYAATTGGAAMSTSSGMLEEFLRGSDGRMKRLREAPGFAEAVQRVVGTGASWLSYENRAATARAAFETLKKKPGAANALSVLLPLPAGLESLPGFGAFQKWMDPSLLPPFDPIAKYFSFAVSAMNVTADGITVRSVAPTPPELKRPE